MSRERWSRGWIGHAPTRVGFYSDCGGGEGRGTLSTLAEAGAEGCALAGSPRSRAPSPAARPDRRRPAGQNLQRLPREHPPVLGRAGEGTALAEAITLTPPRQTCPAVSATLSQIGDLPSLKSPHRTLYPACSLQRPDLPN